MKALFTAGSEVPLARIVADHRRVLVPLGALLAINLGVLVLLVLPLRASVESGGTRAQASSLALADDTIDLGDPACQRVLARCGGRLPQPLDPPRHS